MISCALCKNKKEKCHQSANTDPVLSCHVLQNAKPSSLNCWNHFTTVFKFFRDMRMKAILYATNSPHIYISNILVYEIKPVSF